METGWQGDTRPRETAQQRCQRCEAAALVDGRGAKMLLIKLIKNP